MNKSIFVLIVSILGNSFLIIIKILFGILGHSKSLIADGVHSLSDLSTDIIAIFGNLLSNKEADKAHPFGHGKIEYITSMIISIIIIILGFTIILNSFNKKFGIPSIMVIFVSLITIIIKYFIAKALLDNGKKLNNQILLSSGKESFMDVFSSIMVLIITLLSQLSDTFPIFKCADTLGSTIIGVIIIIVGIKLLCENASLIIGVVEDNNIIINNIKDLITNYNSKIDVKKIVLLKNGPYYKTDVHLLVDARTTIRKGDILKSNIINLLKELKRIKYITIELSSKEK